jgi:hypothetical protein
MLPMQADPIREWQTLTAHYRELCDDELSELATDFNHLTDTARQVLSVEMRSRGLADPQAASPVPIASNAPPPANASPATPAVPAALDTSASIHDPTVNPLIAFGRSPELVPDTPNVPSEEDGPVEYTWKTLLCECDTAQEASELSESLRQAGIESWIEGPKPSAYSAYASLDLINPRVLVAADQLEQARAIAARPIPPEIVEESEAEVPEFVPPSCPKCGAGDPVLETVDPANSWKCEQCGERWTEAAPAATQEPRSEG